MLARSILVLALTSCATSTALKPATLKYSELSAPGFFDIGAGYARVNDTRNTDNDDSEGLTISLKAYPLGRWYGEPKASLQKGLTADDRNVLSLIHQHHVAKNAAIAASAAPTPIDSTTANAGNALVRRPDVTLSHDERILVQRAIDDSSQLSVSELASLEQLASAESRPPKWHVVEERSSFYHRFSVFYARSISDFDSGGLLSEVNAVGIAFDVSPELSLQLGYGFYEVDDGNGIDSDSSLYFGVSLNLYSLDLFGSKLAGLK